MMRRADGKPDTLVAAALLACAVAGCGTARYGSTLTGSVVFFGVDLATGLPLDHKRVSFAELPCPQAPGAVVGTTCPSRLPRAPDGFRPGPEGELPDPGRVVYVVTRTAAGQVGLYAWLDLAGEKSTVPTIWLRLTPGEAGVILLPDRTSPRVAVCYVVTRSGEMAETGGRSPE